MKTPATISLLLIVFAWVSLSEAVHHPKFSKNALDLVWAIGETSVQNCLTSIKAVMTSQPPKELQLRLWVLAEPLSAKSFAAKWSELEMQPACQIINFTEIQQQETEHIDCMPWTPAHNSSEVNVISYTPTDDQRAAVSRLRLMPGGHRSQKKLSNIIRNWLPDFLLPFGVATVLYLDPDAVVQAPLNPLISQISAKALTVPSRIENFKHDDHPYIKERHGGDPVQFNTDVMVVQLSKFCKLQIPSTIEQLFELQATDGVWAQNNQLDYQMILVLAVPSSEVELVSHLWNSDAEDAYILLHSSKLRRDRSNQTQGLEHIVRDWPRDTKILAALVAKNPCLKKLLPGSTLPKVTMPWSTAAALLPDNTDRPGGFVLNGHKYVDCSIGELSRSESFERARLLSNRGDPSGLHGEHSLLILTVTNPYDRLINMYKMRPHLVCGKESTDQGKSCRSSFHSFLLAIKDSDYAQRDPLVLPAALACNVHKLTYDLFFKVENIQEENACFSSALWPGTEWTPKPEGPDAQETQMNSADITLINTLYKIDFDTFDYEKKRH